MDNYIDKLVEYYNEKSTKNITKLVVITFVIYLSCVVALTYINVSLFLAVFIAMLIAIIYARKKDLVKTLDFFRSIDTILRTSCDVVLYNNTLIEMLDWLDNKELSSIQVKRILRPLQQRYILGLITNHQLDKAIEYVEDNSLRQYSNDGSISIGLANLEIAQAIDSKDTDLIEEVLAKYTNKKAVNTTSLQANLFILKGNNQQAVDYLLNTKPSCTLHNCTKAYLLGTGYMNLEDTNKAIQQFEYVLNNGCTLPIKYESDKVLSTITK